MSKYVDEDWFEDAERESFENYCYDIADEGDEVIVDDKLIKKSTAKYHDFLKEHPELDEFLTNQIGKLTTSKDPQMFIFQQIW